VGRATLFIRSRTRTGTSDEKRPGVRGIIPMTNAANASAERAPGTREGEPEKRAGQPRTRRDGRRGRPGDSSRRAGDRRGRPSAALRAPRQSFTVAAAVFGSFALVALFSLLTPARPTITQQDVDRAVAHAIETRAADPALATIAYASVARSVVRVRILNSSRADERQIGIGTGVIIQASGEILTNLHVVAGAPRLSVVFADGFESEAQVIAQQPENDLAVLMPQIMPEELPPAILGNSGSLRPGDPVVVVGHPFGIGPSVSAGIVSGLGRTDESHGGGVRLENLIQFDAAANPGNSGGPLVNARGEVVGIVTSIVNPTHDAFFVGIGFAVPIETAARAVGPNPF
jgi:S1-C subfamily serine protease